MKRDFIVLLISLMLIGLLGTASMSQEAGTWTQKADMPTARYLAGSAVVDGKIYVIGGNNQAKSAVEEYDPATDTWSPAFDMTRIRFGHTASVVAGKMYIIGGGEPPPARLGAIVDVYDPATDTWTTAPDYPVIVGDHTAVVVDGKICTIGGAAGYTVGGVAGNGSPITSTVYEFDPSLSGGIAVTSPAGKLLRTWGEMKSE